MTTMFRNSGHGQPSPLQQAIDKAIDGSQPAEDWGLIIKICDHVATHEESAKEAMKLIRKRLQISPLIQGWRSIGLILTLLEALTKNCGKAFHLQIAHKDFLKELKGVIGPKNNPPISVQERVLSLIQTWALAFRQDPDLKSVDHFYNDCKQHGLQFPPPEPENMIKTLITPTPTRTAERPLQPARSLPPSANAAYKPQNRPVSHEYPQHAVQNPSTMSADQIAKLRSELDIVQTNAQVFGEMLVTLQPGEENPQDFELLMELHNTCKQMQARIVDLLSQISIDDITVDLLRYNDEFNNSFKTFESYMQERNRRFGQTHMPTSSSRRTASPIQPVSSNKPFQSPYNSPNEQPLISFDDDPIPNFPNMRVTSTSNTTPRQPTASVVTRPTTANHNDPERDIHEVEQWLKIQGDDPEDEGGTTAAFDNFLQKRASTIPDEAISEQNINFHMQDPSKHNQKQNSYL